MLHKQSNVMFHMMLSLFNIFSNAQKQRAKMHFDQG